MRNDAGDDETIYIRTHVLNPTMRDVASYRTTEDCTSRVSKGMMDHGWPLGTQAQQTLMKAVAESLRVRCSACNESTGFCTSGSNQYMLRLKCGRCGKVLANPRVARIG